MLLASSYAKHPFTIIHTSKKRGVRTVVKNSYNNESIALNALDRSLKLASIRARESSRTESLFHDENASLFINVGVNNSLADSIEDAYDIITTKFIDSTLIHATCSVNINRNQEYNQVVLVGDGMDTRPFRLPWPTGTAIYLVAPGEVHERAEAILASAKIRVPRGCLLRRVDSNFVGAASCLPALYRAGFRGDRLSLWALQGHFAMDDVSLNAIFTDMSNAAALESILVGELNVYSEKEAERMLAAYGLLGTTMRVDIVGRNLAEQSDSMTGVAGSSGWWWLDYIDEQHSMSGPSDEYNGFDSLKSSRRVFKAQQRRLSESEIELYEAHTSSAEESEDFFGNFS